MQGPRGTGKGMEYGGVGGSNDGVQVEGKQPVGFSSVHLCHNEAWQAKRSGDYDRSLNAGYG